MMREGERKKKDGSSPDLMMKKKLVGTDRKKRRPIRSA